MTYIDWHYNEEAQRWEGYANACHMHVQVDFDEGHAVFLASVQQQEQDDDEHEPVIYAPEAFHQREDAQAWCEETVRLCATEESRIQQALNKPVGV